MLVQASHGPRIFALLLSSDGWTGQVLLASGAIVFTSFGRNLKKKCTRCRSSVCIGLVCSLVHRRRHECSPVYIQEHRMVRLFQRTFLGCSNSTLFFTYLAKALFFPLQIVSFLFPRKSDMAASNGFVDRLMQAHVTSFQHWLKSPDTPFVHSQCHECLEHPAV